ncbi:response regulator transcription factor [Acidaminobacter sp. JC074]|uniref:response regulator transcription factor n=1 Tax=Acidaminobacter sp. JC074 TaxID=2530199 RepID=UPI001F0F33B7|nr:response regulator transcription factor [Acidaminobacter sp. JC074]MCH4886776.1 response regulator transcription factor [Acidaminobacter sp. JC074]
MRRSKILVVEDEREIGLLLKKYLEVENYDVVCKEDGKRGLNAFNEDVFDLVISDIMMPEMDGVALCKAIRKISNVPIIFLTAKDDEVDKLLGLMQGADDYITKPFSIKEVVARVKAILRRYLELSQGVIPVAILEGEDISIDFTNNTVIKNGQEVSLRTKEYEILELLAKQPDKVFSKGQIFEKVWGSEYLGDDNTVMVHIRRIRNKLEDDPNEPRYIQTVWGLGYKFTLKDESDE